MSHIYGLVLTGGKSTRMKQDKASLEYHGKKQSVAAFELLSSLCEKVFISNRKDQANDDGQKNFLQIHDLPIYEGIGPMAGILSAMTQYPGVAWLILACDLPFVDKKTLEYLIKHRNPQKVATAFISTADNLPEPLCAIYEPHSQDLAITFFNTGKTCPRKFLINSDVELLKQPDPKALINVNTPQEYENIKKNSY